MRRGSPSCGERRRRSLAITSSLVAVVALAAGCGGAKPRAAAAPGATTVVLAPRYAAAPTRRCLRARGASVTPIRARAGRLRELRDLAQRTSFEVKLRGRSVGLAFGNTPLLSELLRVPNDRYRIATRGNALLLYRPGARAQAAVVRSCLRP